MDIGDSAAIVTVSTTVEQSCPFCGEWMGGEMKFDESVRHLIEAHGCTLLHVGTQTTPDQKGGPWHSTVAVVGTSEAPPTRTTVGTVKIGSANF